MSKRKQFTRAELKAKGYLSAGDAARALRSIADDLAQRPEWIKFSLNVWYQVPKGSEVAYGEVQPVSVTLVSGPEFREP